MRPTLYAVLLLLFCQLSLQAQWDSIPFSGTENDVIRVSAVDSMICWTLGANSPDIRRVINGGATPGDISASTLPLSNLRGASIEGVDANTAWATCFNGTTMSGGAIYKTMDGGSSWTRYNPAAFSDPIAFANWLHQYDIFHVVCMGDPTGGYFEIWTSDDGGVNWVRTPTTSIPAPLSGEYGLTDIYCWHDQHVWFGTNKGRVFHSGNYGLNWDVLSVPAWGTTEVYINGIAFKDSLNGYISGVFATGGMDTGIYKTTDGGLSWNYIGKSSVLGLSGAVLDIHYVPGTYDCWVFSTAMGSAFTVDGGATYSVIDTKDHQSLSFSGASSGWSGSTVHAATGSGLFRWDSNLFDAFIDTSLIPDDTIEEPIDTTEDTTALIEWIDADIELYPNPVKQQLFVKGLANLAGFKIEQVQMDILDAQGKIVIAKVAYSEAIDLSRLQSGLYCLRIHSGTQSLHRKFLKE